MHLPPEVERLVPELLAEVTGAEPARERELIVTLLLAGDAGAWLDYLRERAQALAGAPEAGSQSAAGAGARAALAGILRDQLVLIQSVVDLGPGDLALVDRLETIEADEVRRTGSRPQGSW